MCLNSKIVNFMVRVDVDYSHSTRIISQAVKEKLSEWQKKIQNVSISWPEKRINCALSQSIIHRSSSARLLIQCKNIYLMTRWTFRSWRNRSIKSQWCRWWCVLNLWLNVDTRCHLLNCHHNTTTSAQWFYPQIDQIRFVQRWKDCHIDFSIDKMLHVMLKSDSGQQGFDVMIFRQLAALSCWCWVEQRCCHVK